MKTVTLSATFEGQQIRLEQDYPRPALVTVLPASGDREDDFRRSWYGLAAESLAGAYGPEEPEYMSEMLKEPNPRHESR